MKSLIFALLLLTVTFPTLAADQSAYDRIKQTGTIRCGYFTWAPYIIRDPNTGTISGINYDFMAEIGKILGLKIEWVEEVSAGTAITALDAGRYDVMCASLWPDAGRLKNSLLTEPEFYSTAYVVVRSDDNRFDHGKMSINDPSVKIVGIEGDITYNLIGEKYPKAKAVALPQTSDASLLFESLITKKADVVLIDKGGVADFNRRNKNALKLAEGLPLVQVFGETLAVKSGETQLHVMLNNALGIIRDTGKAQELVHKYKEYGYYAPVPNWKE